MNAASFAPGEGERLGMARARKALAIRGTLFAIGLLSGIYLGYKLTSDGLDLGASWDPAIALALAAIYVAAIGIGSILLREHIDELEQAQTYKATMVAGSGYLLVYPTWFLLWKAALAPEPIHWALFLGFWALLIGSAIYYRFK